MTFNNLSAKVSSELSAGVDLCDDCSEVLRLVVPAVLQELDILEYDEETGYKLKQG